MNPHWTIRPYQASDRGAIARLWLDCDLVVPQNDPGRDIDRKVAHSPELLLVAALGDQVVGTVMVGYDGHRGHINYLAVEPSLHRSGLGRRLMQAAEERLAALGCPKVNLVVRGTNTRVLAFYDRMGYQVEDRLHLGRRLIDDSLVNGGGG
jgi:ribosomal protein S18 acetylase RimI-like enzyme